MIKTSLPGPVIALCAALAAAAVLAAARPATAGNAIAAAVTVSECHVYAHLGDTVVTRPRKRRVGGICGVSDPRPRVV